jgi:hypothetical protein
MYVEYFFCVGQCGCFAVSQSPRRAAGDLEFAVHGGVPDRNASWASLLPFLPDQPAAAAAAAAQGPRRAAGDLEFAVRGGVPDLNASWATLLPQLALAFPFELDTFQKEAIVHLEQGHPVRAGGAV